MVDNGRGWRRPSVDRGASRRVGTIGASMGESSARKRRDRVLGPGPAREELCEEEKERRGERYTGAMEMGSDLERGTEEAWQCPCPSSSSAWQSLSGGDGGGGPTLLSRASPRETTCKKGSATL